MRLRSSCLILAGMALALGAPRADAQRGRSAMPPARSTQPRVAQPERAGAEDASLAVLWRGHSRLIRPCSAYFDAMGTMGPAPQMGMSSPAPGANGLPPVPGLGPTPGMAPAPGLQAAPGLSPAPGQTPTGSSTGTSTLRPLHSGWRTAGTVHIDGACYVRDRSGNLQIFQF